MNLTYQLVKRLGLRKRYQNPEPIQIFGDPRSGSTWLAEIFSQLEGHILVDEPLNLNHNSEFAKIGFTWRHHINEKERSHEAKRAFERLYAGKFSAHSVASNSIWTYINSKNSVLKFIRAKLLLPWLLQNFEFKKAPIYLIRNPLALIHSMSFHEEWKYSFKRFDTNSFNSSIPFKRHDEFLATLNTNLEQQLAIWCISNQLFFSSNKLFEKMIIVRYEDLCANPKQVLGNILSQYNYSEDILESLILDSPSSSSRGKLVKTIDQRINGWKKNMDSKDRKSYEKILSYFQIDY